VAQRGVCSTIVLMAKKESVTNEKIMEVLLDMNERMVTKDDLTDILKDYPTKTDLERMKIEIIEPIIKAVDKDAEIIYSHGKRITALERKIGITTK
jgi:hypothetical protein